MGARDSNVDLVRGLSGRDLRRDESAAVRFTRSRTGISRRLSHRIFVDEIRALLSRRVRGNDHRRVCCGHVFFRRLAFSWNSRWITRLDFWPDQHRGLLREGRRGHSVYDVGTLDIAPVSLGPTDAPRLAVFLRNRARKHLHRRGPSRLLSLTTFLFLSLLI